MSKYYKFEGVIAPNSGSGPEVNFTLNGQNGTELPLADPTATYTAGYWYELADGAEITGGHQRHSGTDFEPVLFVEHPREEVPYPIDTGEPA